MAFRARQSSAGIFRAPSDPARRIEALTPRSRCGFLLLAMECFDEQETAQILGVDVPQVRRLIEDAGREIAHQIATNVLIIEDEPLIAMDLESIMEQLGHRVVGIARTHGEPSSSPAIRTSG